MTEIIKKYAGKHVFLNMDLWPEEINKTKIVQKLIDKWIQAGCPLRFEIRDTEREKDA